MKLNLNFSGSRLSPTFIVPLPSGHGIRVEIELAYGHLVRVGFGITKVDWISPITGKGKSERTKRRTIIAS